MKLYTQHSDVPVSPAWLSARAVTCIIVIRHHCIHLLHGIGWGKLRVPEDEMEG